MELNCISGFDGVRWKAVPGAAGPVTVLLANTIEPKKLREGPIRAAGAEHCSHPGQLVPRTIAAEPGSSAVDMAFSASTYRALCSKTGALRRFSFSGGRTP